MKYQHFLITRFNLKKDNWVNDKNNIPLFGASDDWLKRRFELFEGYCLPSVKSQINKNFKWLVYFSIDTPDAYKEKVKSFQLDFPNFSPKFIPSMNELVNSIKSDISTDCSVFNNSIIITTRLDNDDALQEGFINKIQLLIESKKIINGIIDIPNGYCLQVNPKPLLAASIQYSNAFITYLEPYISINELLTVMHKSHPEWAYSVKTYVIEKEKLWMQIIHEKNVLNKVQGIITNDERNLNGFKFSVNIKLKKRDLKQIIHNDYLKFPIYFLKKKCKKLFLKLRYFKRKNYF